MSNITAPDFNGSYETAIEQANQHYKKTGEWLHVVEYQENETKKTYITVPHFRHFGLMPNERVTRHSTPVNCTVTRIAGMSQNGKIEDLTARW